jgi:capsular polysaccharide transport system permease protein
MSNPGVAYRRPGLAEGARVQARVVGALILRELKTRFGRNNLGYLWAVIEPVLLITIIAAVFMVVGGELRRGFPTASFVASGYVPFRLFMSVLQRARSAVDGNRGLLMHPRVTALDVIAARALLEGATYLSVMVVLVLGIVALGFDGPPHSPLGLVADLALAMLLGLGLGLVIGAASVLISTVERLLAAFNRVMFFISGIFFVPASLPGELREPLLINPLLHITEFARISWYGPVAFETYGSLGYVAWWVLGLVCLGLVAERAVRPYLGRVA